MYQEVFTIYPSKYRSNFFLNDNKGLYFSKKNISHDINIYKNTSIFNSIVYKNEKFIDITDLPKTIIRTKEIDFPDIVKFKKLSYTDWKKYSNKLNLKSTIIQVINLTVIDCLIFNKETESFEAFPIINLLTKRPLLWKSFIDIIKHFSNLNFNIEEYEKNLSKEVDKAKTNYLTTLDGIYDRFVWYNAPHLWEYYKKLSDTERTDFLGFLESVTNVNVYMNLMATRKGNINKLILTPAKSSSEMSEREAALDKTTKQMIQESTEKLQEQIKRDKMLGKKRTINTELENQEFNKAES